MGKKWVHTCYGCPEYYTEKGCRYPNRHCEYVDHWDCPVWKKFTEDEKESIVD